jgi:hypothetical protein
MLCWAGGLRDGEQTLKASDKLRANGSLTGFMAPGALEKPNM